MPELSTIRKFVDAVKTRETTVTKGLKALWNARGQEPALVQALATLTMTPLDPRLRQALIARGKLTNDEVNHLDKWPDPEKVKVRNALVTALGSSPVRDAQFYWEFYDGAASVTQVDNLAGPGDIIVTFRSPRANLRIDSTFNLGEIKVDVP